jgi:hypothetical protein
VVPHSTMFGTEMGHQFMENYIPLDKSWIIRMGVLDLIHGSAQINSFLAGQSDLGDDLIALKNISVSWSKDMPVDVGESGTLYRLLKFVSWKFNLNKKFVTKGTLKNRVITDDPKIVNLKLAELLTLDNRTSQWATASVLCGNDEMIPNPPYKLKLTYEAVAHWNAMAAQGKPWEPRYDTTIEKQAETFGKLLKKQKINFVPEQAEDFCFAYTFGFVSKEEGEKRWPSLRGHESDRITEIETTLEKAKNGMEIDSKDHRVVQAIAMWGIINKKELKILYPAAVNKSWPQFWEFLDFSIFKKNE